MRLTLRADADATIGAGHVVRCAAIAQAALELGHEALLATVDLPSRLVDKLRHLGVAWQQLSVPSGTLGDAEATLAAQGEPADWVFVDGYHLGPDFQRALRTGGGHLMILDDYAVHQHYEGSALLNPAGEALASIYRRVAPQCELLLGPRYAAVQAEFAQGRSVRAPRRPERTPVRLLVTMGAGDPFDLTTLAIDAIDRIEERLSARLIVGPLNPRLQQLRRRADASRHELELIDSPESMLDHMRWADLALSAAGSTSWELACLGIPALILPLVDNQRWVAHTLTSGGAAVALEGATELEPQRLTEALLALLEDTGELDRMTARAAGLVDGRGSERVLEYCLRRLEG